MTDARVGVIIPAFNEERSIANVLDDIPRDVVHEIIVVDNASDDATAQVAARHGARVIREKRRGYGSACLAGIAALDPSVNVVVFLDGDYSDYPAELTDLIVPICQDRAELVIGSRVLGERERGALAIQARFGNWLATRLIRWIWGVPFTDLGPFRAITKDALDRLHMCDTTYGWTVEMQIKAAMLRVPSVEIPVRYRRRIGKSKITGTARGTILAGWKILSTIALYWNFGRGRDIGS
ncbi:MAG: glycosyltransferase family 2 protein [Candidatus Poribacteria bacterium]|nr:glycosyltransferase family 2 protein [Candidatus Poribacteria bacterium]